MERHTPATHPNSGEEHPYPARSDHGTLKNIVNIGDLVRWQTDRLTLATSSGDLGTPQS